MSEDTIAAPATPSGAGAIGIIRISGQAAIPICDRIFRGSPPPSRAPDRSVLFGEIVASDGAPIDQVLVVVMRGPRSLTGEDVVEINCHGGVIAPRLVLRRVIEEGARVAEAGEFTKRAFLNGKIDLTQAEAVSDVIHASSEQALRVAMRQLKGGVSERIGKLERHLLEGLVMIEANIDFVEDEVEGVDRAKLEDGLQTVADALEALRATYEQGRYIKDGLHVAIVGRPNVGKSSLFNRLIGRDRVMVSEIPGTTRDVVDGLMGVNGMMLRLHDTAGVREGGGSLDRQAVGRTRGAIDEADIALVVIDLSDPVTAKDLDILEEVRNKLRLIVGNKTDLPARADLADFEEAVRVSALTGKGMPDLLEALRRTAHAQVDDLACEIVVSERHAACLRDAGEGVTRAMRSLQEGMPLECIASDVRQALDRLGEITGSNVSAQVLDEIFSRFCIGK